jgi:hypothetical protein
MKFSKSRRIALAGGAALVVGGAAVASVAAQQQAAVDSVNATTDGDTLFINAAGPTDLADRRQAWLKAVAAKLGVTPERLDQAIQHTARDQGLPPPLLMPFPGPGLTIGTPATGAFSVHIDSGFGAAAKVLGITEDQLRKEAAGKSLTDVAHAHNVDPKVVADALKGQRRADLDKAAADGKLPAQLVDRLRAELDQEIDRLMQLPGIAAGNAVFRFERSVVSPEP